MCPDVTDGLPCEYCAKQRLHDYLESPFGRLLLVITDLDFAIDRGMGVSFDEISYLEFRLLRIFLEEKNRRENEQIEKAKTEPAHR